MAAEPHVVVAGGGAAGFFAAITAAEEGPGRVTLLEKGPRFLDKVRISGGGRCNVTHDCFDPRELARRYPRGNRALIGPFTRFGPRETVAWFEARGVKLKREADGRMFPVTDDSETVVQCLLQAARVAGVDLRTRCGLAGAVPRPEGGFTLALDDGASLDCQALLVATGGVRTPPAAALLRSLGHPAVDPVPSLFTFHLAGHPLADLAGVSVADAEVSLPGTPLRERGPLLITHSGLSGPAVLRLSAWGARDMATRGYRFPLQVRWLPGERPETVAGMLSQQRTSSPARSVVNSPPSGIPLRLWQHLVLQAGIARSTPWNQAARGPLQRLASALLDTRLEVDGKSLNKEEFVTCGGVALESVDFRTMESRFVPGLHFAGEVLDLDGITGGFNFQAAWTTGWHAGQAMMARAISSALASP